MTRICLLALVLAGACTGATEPDPAAMPLNPVTIDGTLSLTAVASIQHDTVRVVVRVANRGQRPGSLEYGCSFAIRAVSPAGQTWDNRLPPGAVCIGIGILVPVGPGTTRFTEVFRGLATELRARAAGGEYTLSVYYRERGDSRVRRLNAGVIRL